MGLPNSERPSSASSSKAGHTPTLTRGGTARGPPGSACNPGRCLVMQTIGRDQTKRERVLDVERVDELGQAAD